MSDDLICEVNPNDVMAGNLAHGCPLAYGPSGAEKCALLWSEKRIEGMYGVKCPTRDSRCSRMLLIRPSAPAECPLRRGQVLIKAGCCRSVPEVIVKAKRRK